MPLGSSKIAFTGTGNKIQVSTTDLWVNKFFVEPHDTNAGKTYIGLTTLDVSNKIWLGWLPPPTANFVETFNSTGVLAMAFNLKDLYLAGDNTEGATVTYEQA